MRYPQSTSDAPAGLGIRTLIWWLIGVFIAVALFVATLISPNDPIVTLTIFSTRFLGIFIEAAPFLLLGVAVSGLLEVFVTKEDIVRMLPRNPVLATIGGAFLGFVFPVCECGVVPVTRRLFMKGLPMSVGVAFLLAAPVMNPIVLVSTYIAFGWGPMLWVRFIGTAIIAIAIGVLFAMVNRPQDILLPTSLAPVSGGSGTPPADLKAAVGAITPRRLTARDKVFQAFRFASDDFFDMGRFLVVGTLLAALMQTFVPQESLLALGQGPVMSVIFLQLVAFVLSVCSTVDSFLALAFVGTFTSGSIAAFLTFGPMVDIKSAMMYAGVFKPRTVLYLTVLPFIMSLFMGVMINQLALF